MEAPNLAMIPSGVKAGKLYSIMPENGVGDFSATRNSTATRVNKDGLIETVAQYTPRLNYDLINGKPDTCPHYLLEPQSTNLIKYSNDYTQSEWNKISGATVDANVIISPDGTLNASRLNFDTVVGSRIEDQITNVGSGDYSFAVYLKADEPKTIGIRTGFATTTIVSVNVTTEWQRFSITQNNPTNPANGYAQIRSIDTSGGSVYVWGAQMEYQNYATSLIPTSGTTVTRAADSANGAGDASTFNSEQGILFAEFSALANDGTYRAIYINDNAATRYVGLRYSNNANQIQAISFDGSNLGFIAHTLSNATAFSKFAVKFGATGISLYIDGSLIGSDATFTGIASNELDELLFNSNSGTQAFYGKCKDLRVYDTEGMTDTEIDNLLTQLTQ